MTRRRTRPRNFQEFSWDFAALPAPWVEDLMDCLGVQDRRAVFQVSRPASIAVLSSHPQSTFIAKIDEPPQFNRPVQETTSKSNKNARTSRTTNKKEVKSPTPPCFFNTSSRSRQRILTDFAQHARHVVLHVVKRTEHLHVATPHALRDIVTKVMIECINHAVGNNDIRALGLAHFPRLTTLAFKGDTGGFGNDCKQLVPSHLLPASLCCVEVPIRNRTAQSGGDIVASREQFSWGLRTCAKWLSSYTRALYHFDDTRYGYSTSLEHIGMFKHLAHFTCGYCLSDAVLRHLATLPHLQTVSVTYVLLDTDWSEKACASTWQELRIGCEASSSYDPYSSTGLTSVAYLPLSHIRKVVCGGKINAWLHSYQNVSSSLQKLESYDGLHLAEHTCVVFQACATTTSELLGVLSRFKGADATYEVSMYGLQNWAQPSTSSSYLDGLVRLPSMFHTIRFYKANSYKTSLVEDIGYLLQNRSGLQRIEVPFQDYTFDAWQELIEQLCRRCGKRMHGPEVVLQGRVMDNTPWLRAHRPEYGLPAEVTRISRQTALRRLAAQSRITLDVDNLFAPGQSTLKTSTGE